MCVCFSVAVGKMHISLCVCVCATKRVAPCSGLLEEKNIMLQELHKAALLLRPIAARCHPIQNLITFS